MTAQRSPRRTPRWSGCSILAASSEHPQLWRFNFGSNQATLQNQSSIASVPKQSLTRTWRHFFTPHLNIAWLPTDQVYLRVIHLPPGDPDEVASMLELQLDKVSPLPVAQIAWSYEIIDPKNTESRTVIMVLADRESVEAHLGRLEPSGFLADRIEIPWVHLVASEPPAEATTRLYLESVGAKMLCLAAWWQDGRLESLDLVQATDDEPGTDQLTDQLSRLAWAGEVQGWLRKTPQFEIIVAEEKAPLWESALRRWSDDACTVRPAPPPQELATISAQRAATRRATTNLVPEDYAARFRQQFIDRLWMRGLASLLVIYLLGVLGYAASVQYYGYQADSKRMEARLLAPAYTNALALKERVRIAQEQAALKYAALDCLLAVSERLPHSLTLESFNFQGGNRLFVSGSVAEADQATVTEFNADLRRAQVGGELLFEEDGVATPSFTPRGRGRFRWDFTAKLKAPWLE